MPYRLAPNIELLFTEAGDDPSARVRAAAEAGFDAVELWTTHDKDVAALARTCTEVGVSVTSVLAEPRTNFALPWTDLAEFWDGLDRSVANAEALGCPRVVLGSGVGFPGMKRTQNLDRLADVFRDAVDRVRASGVSLVLEAVNTRVDHPGALLDRTGDAVTIARAVGDPSFGILYDLYHSVTESEDVEAVLAEAGDLVHYVQIADSPGRGEPGTGAISWAKALDALAAAGYSGPIGLEYFPQSDSVSSLTTIRQLAAR